MKFFKVFAERKQWAVVYVATKNNVTENSVMNLSASVESAAKKQIEDQMHRSEST